MAIQSINPATGEILRTFEPLTEDLLEQKLAAAAESFRGFADVPLEHKTLWMKKLAGVLESEKDELAALLTREIGKTITASRAEISKCALACRYYADHAAKILAEEAIPTEGNTSSIRWEPLGVVLAVMPWNFPFWQVFCFLAPALMAGNVALLKHSSNVPLCAMAIESLVRRAGFPRGTFQTLLIDIEQVERVIADERVAAVTVTGSEAAGRAVAAQAGWLIKKSVLELGGSDPFLVMPSAAVKIAADTAVRARTVNNGQSCIAAKRFIVHERIYEEFVSRFVEGMEALKVGDPMKEDTDVGPLATAAQLDEVEAQLQAMVAAGAEILSGGGRMEGRGNFFEPTVVAGVPRTAPVYREEVFGPVAMLFRVRSLEQAIEVANDTPFGLGASVWTQDAEEQRRLISGLECGAVFVNAMVATDPRLPFGGVKKSGYGRQLSAAGMREFLNAKTVVIANPVQQTVIPFEPLKAEAPKEEEPLTAAELEELLGRDAYEPGKFAHAIGTALKGRG